MPGLGWFRACDHGARRDCQPRDARTAAGTRRGTDDNARRPKLPACEVPKSKSKSERPAPTPPLPPNGPAADDAIEVRESGIHGRGVFAARPIARGETVGVYAGRRYSAEQAAASEWDHALTYVFGLADGSLIDGAEGGNATRFINHSCEPNCAAFEVTADDGLPEVRIEALRRIARHAELLLDYRLDVGDAPDADYPCRCGSARCRGTLRDKAAG
jgi:uncharacterized protein